MSAAVSAGRRCGIAVRAVPVLLILVGGAPSARAQMAAASARAQVPPVATPTPEAAASPAPPVADAPGLLTAPPSETPSFLELAERLRALSSFSECTVEALRYAYDRPADRERGFERAALCLSLAGRHDDARRLMLALPSEGTPLGARSRLRICLAEVFLPDLGAPACVALEPRDPRDRSDELAHETLLMRKIHARHWNAAAREVAPLRPPPAQQTSEYDFEIDVPSAYDFIKDPTASAWSRQDAEILRRYSALRRKSALLAGALSAVVPGLGRVYIGRWPDGLLSFLLVGTTGALAAQGFYEEGRGSVRGWILTGVAALLYAGNVYGSAVGAVVQRRDAEDALMREVDQAYERRLDP